MAEDTGQLGNVKVMVNYFNIDIYFLIQFCFTMFSALSYLSTFFFFKG